MNRQQRRHPKPMTAMPIHGGKTMQFRLAATVAVHEESGLYAAVIFDQNTGEPVIPLEFRFNTLEEAKEAGSKIMTATIEKLREKGITAYRPGS